MTTVVELAKRWKRGVFQARPRGRNKHTAMADIEDSIAMLKYFRTRYQSGCPGNCYCIWWDLG